MAWRIRIEQVALLAAMCVPAALAQPIGADLTISAPKTRFYLGERIPLTLSFTSTQPRGFVADSRLQDRIGRMNYIEEFIVDPAGKTEDPLRGLQGEDGGMGGLSGGNFILTAEKPFKVERDLNEWVRFREPGTYRVSVRSRRVRRVTDTGLSDLELQIRASSSPVEVASNVLTIEVAAAPADWVAEQIASANTILDKPSANNDDDYRARLGAGLTLRYLNTRESGIALAKRLNDVNSAAAYAVNIGILDSSYRAELLPAMEQLLVDPNQPISERFITTLAQLSVLVESGGVMPRYPTEASAQQAAQAEAQRRADLLPVKRDRYVSILVENLEKKEPAARVLTRDGLMTIAGTTNPPPVWLNGVIDSLIADFRNLPAQMQRSLMDGRWSQIRDRNVLPLLNDLYKNPPPPPTGYPSILDLVVRHIYELDRSRGRELILAELHRPEGSRINDDTLMMLPDENLPELNPIFSEWLAKGGPLAAQLITRYATGDIVKQVEARYLAQNAELDRQRFPRCPFPVVFYFLKYDPEFGERELRQAFTKGQCYDMAHSVNILGPWVMSPALQRLAIEYLNSPIVPIKRGAAEILGKYGTSAAQQPLWATMEYFRSWWKDREADLGKPAGREGYELERTLMTALGQAGNWKLGASDLRRLEALCSTSNCRSQVSEWMRTAP